MFTGKNLYKNRLKKFSVFLILSVIFVGYQNFNYTSINPQICTTSYSGDWTLSDEFTFSDHNSSAYTTEEESRGFFSFGSADQPVVVGKGNLSVLNGGSFVANSNAIFMRDSKNHILKNYAWSFSNDSAESDRLGNIYAGGVANGVMNNVIYISNQASWYKGPEFKFNPMRTTSSLNYNYSILRLKFFENQVGDIFGVIRSGTGNFSNAVSVIKRNTISGGWTVVDDTVYSVNSSFYPWDYLKDRKGNIFTFGTVSTYGSNVRAYHARRLNTVQSTPVGENLNQLTQLLGSGVIGYRTGFYDDFNSRNQILLFVDIQPATGGQYPALLRGTSDGTQWSMLPLYENLLTGSYGILNTGADHLGNLYVVIHPTGGNYTASKLLRSTDGGISWVSQEGICNQGYCATNQLRFFNNTVLNGSVAHANLANPSGDHGKLTIDKSGNLFRHAYETYEEASSVAGVKYRKSNVYKIGCTPSAQSTPVPTATPRLVSVPTTPWPYNVTTSNHQVNLSWGNNNGAFAYHIKRGTAPNALTKIAVAYPNTVSTITLNQYTDSGLVAGTTYYYAVSALNGYGDESSDTAAIGVIVNQGNVGQLPAPTMFLLGTANNEVLIQWQAVPGATGYSVQRSPSANGTFAEVNGSTTTTSSGFVLVDLTALNGVTYYYRAAALNANSQPGVYTNILSATPPMGTVVQLAAPTVQLTAGNKQVGVQWSRVTGASSYSIKRALSTSGPWSTVNGPTTSLNSNTFVLADLTVVNGTLYFYRVAAIDGNGNEGLYSPENLSVVPVGPPVSLPAPTGFQLTAGNYKVSAQWNLVTDACDYVTMRATNSSGPWLSIGGPSSIVSNMYKFDDTTVTSGTLYYYKVAAVTCSGLVGVYTQVLTVTPVSPNPTPTPSPATGIQFGSCIIRNGNLPGYYAADVGTNYVKRNIGNVTTYAQAQLACTDKFFAELMVNFCTLIPNAENVQWGVAAYDSVGSYQVTGCAASGCDYHKCPASTPTPTPSIAPSATPTPNPYDICRLDMVDGSNITKGLYTTQESCLVNICDIYGQANTLPPNSFSSVCV
ncbi:MAG: hypothetical protein SGI74_01490 [Oligoflexia bacterium]|nr:hypothetical protein [Oligoflexia bacterium]